MLSLGQQDGMGGGRGHEAEGIGVWMGGEGTRLKLRGQGGGRGDGGPGVLPSQRVGGSTWAVSTDKLEAVGADKATVRRSKLCVFSNQVLRAPRQSMFLDKQARTHPTTQATSHLVTSRTQRTTLTTQTTPHLAPLPV